MARVRVALGLTVLPVGWGGSYNPSLDPIAPMISPPITYDMINGRRTTASMIQQTLRENYPVDWSGGISGLGQDDTSGETYDPDTNTYVPITSTDLLGLPILPTGGISTQDLSYLDAGLSVPSNYASATGPITTSGAAVTPIALDPTLVNAINNLPVGSAIPSSSLPSAGQLATIAQQGTSTGLSAAQIAQIFTSAANSGVAIFKATSSPSVIPGTNLVYNPATGQIANATTGLTGVQTAGLGGLSMGTILLFGGVLLVLMMLEKH